MTDNYKVEPRFIPERGDKLNIGSGTDVREDFVNLDYIKHPGVFKWDMEGVQIFPPQWSDRFDYILARDVLEHIPHRTKCHIGEFFYLFINDLIRITSEGGRWEIISPCRPESLGAPGHCRIIDPTTFNPWNNAPGYSLQYSRVAKGHLTILDHINNRQWDIKDWSRFGRAIVKTTHIGVVKDGCHYDDR